MRKKKLAKGKSASRKMKRRKKPIQRKKPRHSKASSKSSSSRIHQGVGPDLASQAETAAGVPESDAEYGGES
jgi:hypothetical protein